MNEAMVKALTGEHGVLINPAMGDRVRVKDGRVHAGSVQAFEQAMEVELDGWVVVQTSPPSLVHLATGQTIEIPHPPATLPPRCERCGVRHV